VIVSAALEPGREDGVKLTRTDTVTGLRLRSADFVRELSATVSL
jgi:hypothetical protein